jgi:hypothetical protein
MFRILWIQIKGILKVLIISLVIFFALYSIFLAYKPRVFKGAKEEISEIRQTEILEEEKCQENYSVCLCIGRVDGEPCLSVSGVCCGGICIENTQSCVPREMELSSREICLGTGDFWCEATESCYGSYEEYCKSCVGACVGEQE